MEFFRYGLSQRGPDILTNLDLSRVNGDAAVFADVQPRIDFFRQRIAASLASAARIPAQPWPA